MGINRRQALLASIAALTLGGCKARSARGGYPSSGSAGRIGPAWGGTPARPTGSPYNGTAVAPPQIIAPAPVQVTPAPTSVVGVPAISRNDWTRTGPIASKVNPMGTISKVTIHHEGWRTVTFTDQNTTAARIEQIRTVHVRDRGWGDIGYHYIVDRAGRVWEGRAIRYQGAHVSENNENNVGILVLGNFDNQAPSDAQLRAVTTAVARLKQLHSINVRNIRSHQEITSTACPGRNMQSRMDGLRRSV